MNAHKFLFIHFILICASYCSPYSAFSEKIKEGVLDASNWQVNSNTVIDLNGEWEFYWMKWITPATEVENKKFLTMPNFWNEITGGEAYGYATYKTKVILPSNFDLNTTLSLRSFEADTAYKIYINGKFLTSSGTPSQSPEGSVPRWEIKTTSFQPDSPVLEIVIHASNYEHRIGGVWKSPLLGKPEVMNKISLMRLSYDLFLFGALLVTGCVHLLFYYLRREENTLLLFALICLFSSLRPLVSDERFILILFPDFSFSTIVRLEYLSYYLVCPLFYQYIYLLFPDLISKKITYIAISLCLLLSSVVILTPVSFFSKTLNIYDSIYILNSFYHLSYFIKASFFKTREGAKPMLLGISSIFLFAMNDIFYFANVFETTNTIALGVFMFVFIQTFYLAEKYSKAYRFQFRAKEKLKQLLKESIKRKQRDKLAVVGHFTSEIVHDIRNRLIALKFASNHSEESIKQEIEELKTVTENILDFAKNQFYLKKINMRIDSFLEELEPEIRNIFQTKEVQIIYDLRFREKMNFDPNKLKSLVLNLARNANDAIATSGNFKIETDMEEDLIYLIFSDSGEGMTEETIHHIIKSDQITTTKTNGHGFGMSSVKRIAQAHKAQILIDSRSGEGTRISLVFPN